jgi:ribosomal-protein-alanine N-acetyltransferase
MIETERLILRRWRPEDLEPYAAMMADPEVTDWLGGGQTRAEAEAMIPLLDAEFERMGFGILVFESKADGVFLGSGGLWFVGPEIPFAPAIEIGWRLARPAWGNGYATEAARAVLADGFGRAGLEEIVSFTAESNRRSRSVMERLGMTRDPGRDFDHPRLPSDHPLRPHVVYASRGQRYSPLREKGF